MWRPRATPESLAAESPTGFSPRRWPIRPRRNWSIAWTNSPTGCSAKSDRLFVVQLPQNLAEHSQQNRNVASGDIQTEHEAADFFFGGCGGYGVDVAALAERLQKLGGDLLVLRGIGASDLFRVGAGGLRVARQL